MRMLRCRRVCGCVGNGVAQCGIGVLCVNRLRAARYRRIGVLFRGDMSALF